MNTVDNPYAKPSFSILNKIGRVLWKIVYVLVFRYSPKPFHAWRAFVLRCFGAKIGYGTRVYPAVKIWAPWNIEIGDECGVGDTAILYSQDKIIVGNRTVIAQGTHVCTGSHDYTSKDFRLITKPIIIEDQVWIAADCFIHPGVTIGQGAVIGACSVITKDMPAWTVCSGHPCVPVRERKIKH